MRAQLKLEEGWLTLVLLWTMMFVSSVAITQADLIDGLQIIPTIGTVAIVAGLLLAKSNFPANRAHFFSFIYGTFFVLLLSGTLLPGDLAWRERVFDIIGRQLQWLQTAFGGGTSRDGLIFVIQTAAIYWLLGYTAAWYTFRHMHIWRVVVPTGMVLLSVVYYYNGPNPIWLYLTAYSLLAFMYVAYTYLVDREREWRAAQVRYRSEIRFSFLRSSFLAALLALVVAWGMPTLTANAAVNDALSGTKGPWRQFQDTWTRLFSSLRIYGSSTSDPYQDTLVLGGPRTVGNTPIMDVYVADKLSNIYWQAIVYDTYEDGRWQTAQNDPQLHLPDDGVLNTPFTLSRQVITQTVVNYLPNSGFLYAAPEPVGSDRQMYVEADKDKKGDLLVTSVRSRYILRQGDRYQMTSRVSTADAQSLRLASNEYPDWVRERYLQLPDSISPETLALAKELTAPYDNNFDKAIVVRDYLRTNITYNDQIPAPPQEVDPVHYTLFVSQEGYCNYYASAMSIILRSQGIPARIVSGYAQGEYDEIGHSYRVRASNAHTWVEVFFPGYGWIQFEPTASIPTVARPETTGNGGDAFSSPSIPDPDFNRDQFLPEEGEGDVPPNLPEDINLGRGASALIQEVSMWQVVGSSAVVLVALALVLFANQLNRRVETDVEMSYVRLGRWGRWLGVLVRPAQTPYERANVLATAVPEGSMSIRSLVHQFVLQQFSANHQADESFDPQQEWQTLRPLFIRRTIATWWYRLREVNVRNRILRR